MSEDNPTIFVMSKKGTYPCLEGPMAENEYEKKLESDHFGPDALVKHKKTSRWTTLHGGTWMLELLPSDWLESKFKNITALCSDDSSMKTNWTVQFEGSTTGPIPASEIPALDHTQIQNKDLFVRATEWQEWVKIADKEWFLGLFEEGKLLSANPRAPEAVNARENPPQKDARGAPRQVLLGTVWWAKVNGAKAIVGSCVDLSTSGAQILFDQDTEYRVGDEMTISFCPSKISSINDLDLLVEIKCSIIWFNAETQRFGVKFIDLSPANIAKLQAVTRNFSE